ncbi:hypothetical protein GCM10011492_06740 [Flexivirga endophytica]|uniref:Uncharacterized protein n=1 Tax=Flexivirga endophytica TaxID=1849103 RepID=A0A916SYQ9_9MICO|nr:hypothetical protein [Flexivirga endophytica]GGB19545.1 hypothetical protein GCM10011492_06740 [Flexivirga endophytica]GHB36149.1 hypothetical protein GCM10008112_00870 [Flexivirga endophytica]
MAADPFDAISALGIRIIYVPDFDDQVSLVYGVGVVLVDPALDRESAARAALGLIAEHAAEA